MLEFDFNKEDNTIIVKRANFEESLRAISDDEVDVGFYECHFSTSTNHNTICVRSEAEYLVADTKYHTSLSSELDFYLNVLNETSEYVEKTKDRSTKRIIKSRVESNSLTVEIEEFVNSASTQSTQRYSLNGIERFISNGALLIMKRIYVINEVENALTAHTLDSEGTLCKFSFELLNEENTEDGSKVQTTKTTKQVLETALGNHTKTMYIYFTNHGQLLSIVEVGLPIVFKAFEFPSPPKKEQYLSTPSIVEDDFNWMENCILFSKYTERKEELKSQYHLYLRNYPELIDLIKDFLQMLLLEKPEDTLHFAAKFFSSFSDYRIQPPRLKETEEKVE
nr:hypothetical protein HmN_000800600 [Hymenolepis microstoma]